MSVRIEIKIKAKIKILGNLEKNNFPKILIKMKAKSKVQKFKKKRKFYYFSRYSTHNLQKIQNKCQLKASGENQGKSKNENSRKSKKVIHQ